MTKVAILPEPTETGDMAYRAIAGERQSVGRTVGEALDALMPLLPEDRTTAIIVSGFRPDQFLGAGRRARLEALMSRWRAARDAGSSLPAREQTELDVLVDAEVRASERRAAAMAEQIAPHPHSSSTTNSALAYRARDAS